MTFASGPPPKEISDPLLLPDYARCELRALLDEASAKCNGVDQCLTGTIGGLGSQADWDMCGVRVDIWSEDVVNEMKVIDPTTEAWVFSATAIYTIYLTWERVQSGTPVVA